MPQQHTNRISLSRPRVIFLLCHRTALLDLLTAWLSTDPYLANLALLRAPIDHLDADGDEDSVMLMDGSCGGGGGSLWMDQVNAWPIGTQGPLLVLLHARSPPFSVAGLRMGPDTRLVICDADWRKDVVSTVKSKYGLSCLRCVVSLFWVPTFFVFRELLENSIRPLLPLFRTDNLRKTMKD